MSEFSDACADLAAGLRRYDQKIEQPAIGQPKSVLWPDNLGASYQSRPLCTKSNKELAEREAFRWMAEMMDKGFTTKYKKIVRTDWGDEVIQMVMSPKLK